MKSCAITVMTKEFCPCFAMVSRGIHFETDLKETRVLGNTNRNIIEDDTKMIEEVKGPFESSSSDETNTCEEKKGNHENPK